MIFRVTGKVRSQYVLGSAEQKAVTKFESRVYDVAVLRPILRVWPEAARSQVQCMPTPDRSSGPVANVSAASFAAAPPLSASIVPDLASGPALAPVRSDERIFALDTIRGFGLLGILLMNICDFGLAYPAYFIPLTGAGGASTVNVFTWCFMTVFADGKMRAIFSLSFGASVYLLVNRLSRKGVAAEAADIHYRRMLWLMLFGIIHAYLIWSGDILYYYAVVGLLLYPLRKLSPKILLITAGVLMLVVTSANGYNIIHWKQLQRQFAQVDADEKAGKKLTDEQESIKREWKETLDLYIPPADDLRKDTEAHLGGYFKKVAHCASRVYKNHSNPFYSPFWGDFLIMMLAGMAFLKLGVLSGDCSYKFYVWMAALSFAIGIPAQAVAAWWTATHHFTMDSWTPSDLTYEIGRFTAFGYIAVILLIVKSGTLQRVTRTLAKVGQMAFSNYILTSVICVMIFDVPGGGLFNKLQRYQLYVVVVLIWAVLLLFSSLWLRQFRFGPLEWVWRSLTYWKKQPFRIT